jgi:hypothetical protein
MQISRSRTQATLMILVRYPNLNWLRERAAMLPGTSNPPHPGEEMM